MKNVIVGMLFLLVGAGQGLAEGFKCVTADEDLNVKIFHHTQPELGVRNAAVMVLSNPSVSGGRKTIATFREVNGTLTNSSSSYEALVDLRRAEMSRKGELVLGTKLGQIESIIVDVDFSYADAPLASGDFVSGRILITKRNGDEIAADLDCSRYLKN